MRFTAIASSCAIVFSLSVEPVSASFDGPVAPAGHRVRSRLSRRHTTREEGWQFGVPGWGGWGWGQRKEPILRQYPGYAPLPTWSDILQSNGTRRSHKGSFLPLKDIQGDIFVGMRKPVELFYFFEIKNAPFFKSALHDHVIHFITSTAVLLSDPRSQPLAFMNIAFSKRGLDALQIKDDLGDSFFTAGQLNDAPQLGDDVNGDWEPAFKGSSIHGVFLIASDAQDNVDKMLQKVLSFFRESINETTRLQGAARPGSQAGHEHFGYLDGVSNPGVTGFTTQPRPGQSVIPAGIILTGQTGDKNQALRPSWASNGSFLVFRKLQQFVPERVKFTIANAIQNPQGTLSLTEGAELLGARMVGRWRSGAPVDLTPLADDPALGSDPNRNNNFDYSHPGFLSNMDQSHCPFSAHTRKTRPRSDLGNSNVANQAIRAGIPYGPEVTDEENNGGVTSKDRGLAFVEYQSNIADGFRFQQRQWANNPNFPPAKNETVGLDPVIGQASDHGARTTFGLNPFDPLRSYSIPAFIKSRGGEYFFSPSITALKNTIAQ